MDKFVVKRARTHPSPPDSPSLRPTNLASTRDDSDDNRLIRISTCTACRRLKQWIVQMCVCDRTTTVGGLH